MKKLLIILGLTATGKTDLALFLAKLYNGELVSCDSRQVYIGLDLGTGKLPGKEVEVKRGKGFWWLDGIKVWMYDVADPKNQYTVKDYVEQSEKVIEDIAKRGKLPIIVGGTGLYFKALLEGMSNLDIPVNEKLRGELQELSVKELQEKLQSLSPISFEKLNNSDKYNSRRLLRSIELLYMNPYTGTKKGFLGLQSQYDFLKIGLTAPRSFIKEKITRRLISRIDQGMIEEAESLNENGLSLQRMRELGLEYGILADLLEKKIKKDQIIQLLGTKICQFAKRQVTWFKKEKGIFWFDITENDWLDKVEKQVGVWYDSGNKGAL